MTKPWWYVFLQYFFELFHGGTLKFSPLLGRCSRREVPVKQLLVLLGFSVQLPQLKQVCRWFVDDKPLHHDCGSLIWCRHTQSVTNHLILNQRNQWQLELPLSYPSVMIFPGDDKGLAPEELNLIEAEAHLEVHPSWNSADFRENQKDPCRCKVWYHKSTGLYMLWYVIWIFIRTICCLYLFIDHRIISMHWQHRSCRAPKICSWTSLLNGP